MVLTVSIRSLSRNDVAIAGGKGASLAEMINAGIPVPDAFVVTSETFETFIDESQLREKIEGILKIVNTGDAKSIDDASVKIRKLIEKALIPQRMFDDINKSFKRLNAKYVAVRSSATAEDGSTTAWAGQLESYLNTTEKELMRHIKKCWSSLFTPRAIFYRFEKKLDATKISVAVVVQKMVESEVSGIAFSVHPVTQDRNKIIIEAGYGLGEAIVSGQITPDSYVVDKKTGQIEKTLNKQTKGLFKGSSTGNAWGQITSKKQSIQKLNDEHIKQLTQIILRIEKHYGFPCDIEWALEKGKLYIVQSRPITTLDKDLKSTKLGRNDENLLKSMGRDYNSPLIINYLWAESFNVRSKKFGIPQAEIAVVTKKNQTEYFGNDNNLAESSGKVMRNINKDMYYITKLIDKTLEMGNEFNKWSQTNLFDADLSKLKNKELIKLYENFIEQMEDLYAYGSILPLLEYGESPYIESNLKKILRKYAKSEKEFNEYYDIFSFPTHRSYSQEQEEALLGIIISEYNKKWREVVITKELSVIKKIYPRFASKLKSHAERFSWIYYGFIGPVFTEKNFLEFVKEHVRDREDPAQKLRLIRKKTDFMASEKKRLIKKFKPDEFEHMILELTGKLVWAKPRRKDHQSRSFYHSEKLFTEISKRLNIDIKDFRNMPPYLVEDSLICGAADKKAIDKLYNFHIISTGKDGKIKVLIGNDAEEFFTDIKTHGDECAPQDTLIGYPACQGIAKGHVKIINEPDDMNKMMLGDVLVSISTNPNIISAIKKASAIITDTGGLTCHAAIVAREFKIPCIVGTKIATQVLNDGDLIEVDADKGIIKILKSQSDGRKNILLTKTYTREHSLLYGYIWNESDYRHITELWGHNIKNFLVLLEPKSGKIEGWNEQSELDEIYAWVADQVNNDPDYYKLVKKRFYQYLNPLLPYLKGKKINSVAELEKYIHNWLHWWSPMDSYLLIPEFNVSKKIKAETLAIREETNHWTDYIDKPFVEFFERKYPEYNNIVKYILPDDIRILKTRRFTNAEIEKIKQRKNGCAIFRDKVVLFKDLNSEMKSNNMYFEEIKIDAGNVLKGMCAYKGNVKGKVRIILHKDNISKLKKGEILVADMTSPDFVPAIRVAGAIITDEGGTTCHAAIAAREFKIPCVAGTGVATKILKDGMMVEVDADNGIVKILKKL